MRISTGTLRLALAGLVTIGTLGVAGCTSSSPTPAASTASTSVTVGGCKVEVSTDVHTAPKVTVPTCATTPAALAVAPVVTGTGAAVPQGGTVTMQYVGIAWSTRKQFASSWQDGKPMVVSDIGENLHVPMGWNFSLSGAHVGDRRVLLFPPDMGFGPAGDPGTALKADETIIYVVDILSVGASTTS